MPELDVLLRYAMIMTNEGKEVLAEHLKKNDWEGMKKLLKYYTDDELFEVNCIVEDVIVGDE